MQRSDNMPFLFPCEIMNGCRCRELTSQQPRLNLPELGIAVGEAIAGAKIADVGCSRMAYGAAALNS